MVRGYARMACCVRTGTAKPAFVWLVEREKSAPAQLRAVFPHVSDCCGPLSVFPHASDCCGPLK